MDPNEPADIPRMRAVTAAIVEILADEDQLTARVAGLSAVALYCVATGMRDAKILDAFRDALSEVHRAEREAEGRRAN